MRERLVIFSRRLHEHDKRICGDAPTWIIEIIASKLEALLQEQLTDEELRPRLAAFSLVATRYVADQSGSESDTLLAALDSLVSDH